MSFLCGYRIFNGTMDEAINKIIATREKVHVISGNPEVLYNGFYNELIYDNFSTNFQTYEENIVEKAPIIVPANLRDFVINICNIDFTDKDSNDNQTFDVYKNISRVIVKDNTLNDGEQLLNNYRVIKYGATNNGDRIYYKLKFEIDNFYKRNYLFIVI